MPTPAIGPFCLSCRHIRKDWTCDAFPQGIPAEIVFGHPHDTPVEGDGGIQFELRPDDLPLPDFNDLMMEEFDQSAQN